MLTPPKRDQDLSREIVRPIQSALNEFERTFLTAQELWIRPNGPGQFEDAFKRLREISVLIDQELGRRDVSFRRARQLQRLQEHLSWVMQRLVHEVFLYLALRLETELKAQIPPSAYTLYLRLVEIESLEQEYAKMSEQQLMELLLTGALEKSIVGAIVPMTEIVSPPMPTSTAPVRHPIVEQP